PLPLHHTGSGTYSPSGPPDPVDASAAMGTSTLSRTVGFGAASTTSHPSFAPITGETQAAHPPSAVLSLVRPPPMDLYPHPLVGTPQPSRNALPLTWPEHLPNLLIHSMLAKHRSFAPGG